MTRLYLLVQLLLGKGKAKAKYAVCIDGQTGIDGPAEIATKSGRITTIVDRIVTKLLDLTAPDTEFATTSAEDTMQTGPTEIRLRLPMGDGYDVILELDLTTDGYTPAQTALHELVAAGISDQLGDIVDIWHPDLAMDDRSTLIDQIETSIGDQLRIGDKAMAGASA